MKKYSLQNILKGSVKASGMVERLNVKTGKGKYLCVMALVLSFSLSPSCKKYLDVVPDNVSVIEHAFKLRNEAEKYLFTCYSFMPRNGDGWYNAAMMGADEIWFAQDNPVNWHSAFRIALGEQNKSDPLFNEWAGTRKGGSGNGLGHLLIWKGIRHCNYFIQNMSDPNQVRDMDAQERARWIAEAQFLKAYYHFYMLRMYGPIPVVDEYLPEDTKVKRMPVDDCFHYITSTLDKCMENLPSRIADENNQLGRVTATIAKALKAKVLLYAASPLFNGNPDYANFRDKDGVLLFNPVYDASKWVAARDAIKIAIDAAEENGHTLYKFQNTSLGLSTETKTQLNIRNAVTDRWSVEHVWANSQSYFINENLCMPPLERGANGNRGQLRGVWSAPLKMAKMFYTKNGIPIEEDKTLDFSNYMQLRTPTNDDRFNIEPGAANVTARLNFDREPRFYASLGFDRGIWYMKDGNALGSDIGTFYVASKNSQRAGYGDFAQWNETGYFIKKLVHWESTSAANTAPTFKTYPWPEIRIADLYLMYAEALNEVEPASALAISYVDKVRERAGLKGVVESWTNYSNNPSKYTTQLGLRDIIRRERTLELAFEGHRLWDLKRWKAADEELNKDITGMNILGRTAETYNIERLIYKQSFIAPRDYFWPIGDYDTRRNLNLVENPGW